MDYRASHTPEWRAGQVRHTIDPGFVHFRKIETVLGSQGMTFVDQSIRSLPELPDWMRQLRIQHIYAQAMLHWCGAVGVKPLGDLLAKRQGRIFCSTEELGPCSDLFDRERAVNRIVLPDAPNPRIELHYSTRHIFGDTPRERLRDGFTFSIIAELQRAEDEIIFDPIVMGSPWLQADDDAHRSIEWHAHDYFEHFVEDLDEFANVRTESVPNNPEPMRDISEEAVKLCFAEILGDAVSRDWGGEPSDYYSAHVHLNGRRVTAAFLFKGPARFAPMSLNHLGKNNDQIVRLADEPADILIVQHCHDILTPVRKTLRAFAVQPSRPRRYCFIDGRDTLRLFSSFGLLDKAREISAVRPSEC